MCLSPVSIVNPTKFISTRYRDRFLLQVPCNKCADCQKVRHNEWYYRAFQHSLEVFNRGGSDNFIQFLTLTYDNAHLPHVSDYVKTRYNFACFNSSHLRQFMTSLRSYISRHYPDAKFSYFIASEYGTSEYYNYRGHLRKSTHRPHYHALFYVIGIEPLVFSQLVSKYWLYGRTDGIPYKSASYVKHNTFHSMRFNESLATINYVSKYVQKSCLFDEKLDKRINLIMRELSQKMPDDWLDSVNAEMLRRKLRRQVSQFHRQSTNFGAYALENIDLQDVMNTGTLKMYDQMSYLKSIPLPTYYKRKLFYQLSIVRGAPTWEPTELGYEYLKVREQANCQRLSQRLNSACIKYNLDFDADKLANYVIYDRGRINASRPSNLDERLAAVNFFNYRTISDIQHLGAKGIVANWLGNVHQGYKVSHLPVDHLNSAQFIHKFVILNQRLEAQLDKIYYKLRVDVDDGKQAAFVLRQHLVNKFHYLNL